MIRVGITGVKGLLGWHLRCYLRTRPEATVVPAGREAFLDGARLSEFASSCDAIVHFAGMNRGDDAEIAETNLRLTEQLIDACTRRGATPHLLFASSTHISRDTAYAKSKRLCAERFRAWAGSSGAAFTNLVIPNAFGERGRPFYNSVVSTFCHQLANGEEPKIIQDATNELIHAQDVAAHVFAAIGERSPGERRLPGRPESVSGLLAKLKEFQRLYRDSILPDLRDPFDLALFNTYRSYLFPARYPFTPPLRTDPRGRLFEAVKGHSGGQTFISTTRPGVTRGNHFHLRKIERFVVIGGDALIRIRRLFGDEVSEFRVSGDKPQIVDIPTLHTHNIANAGSGELTTLFWANEIFDPENPDTFAEPVDAP